MRSRVALLGALLLVAGCSPDAPPPGPVSAVPSSIGTAAPVPTTAASHPVPLVPVVDAGLGATAPDAPPPAPVRLTVPAVGVDLPVDPVGVDDAGQMALPDTAERTGWYRFGPAPGSPAGTTVISGHVDSRRSGIGQLSRLRDVPPGAEVSVTTADGAAHRYQVVEVVRVDKREVPWDQWFDRSGSPRLVLVTCGGTFDRSTGHYRDNLIVTAEPVG